MLTSSSSASAPQVAGPTPLDAPVAPTGGLRSVRRMMGQGVRAARTAWAASAVVGVVSALVCLLVLASAGRSDATERAVLESIDDAGVRIVLVAAQSGYPGMDAGVAERISALSQVEWAVALTAPRDMRNSSPGVGEQVSAREILGELPEGAATLVGGRLPGPGEAAGTARTLRALGLEQVAGAAADAQGEVAVVGLLDEGSVPSQVTDYLLFRSAGQSDDGGSGELASIVVVCVHDALDVVDLVPAIRDLTGAPAAESVLVQTSEQLAEVQAVAAGTFGEMSRQLALGAGAVGTLVVALTITMSVTSHLRDFGRRRALGASRSGLLVLVMTQAVVPAAIGALAGCAVGSVVVRLLTDRAPDASFLLATATLTVVAALVGALPGALTAALRDPVTILRVP